MSSFDRRAWCACYRIASFDQCTAHPVYLRAPALALDFDLSTLKLPPKRDKPADAPAMMRARPGGKPRERRRAPTEERTAPIAAPADEAAPVRPTPGVSPETTPPPPEPAPPRSAPIHAGAPQLPRLSKRMSELGLCSRREADEWIENGWVRVDSQVISTLGTRVSPDARIEIDAAARRDQAQRVTILLNKPIGYVSGQAEDGHQPAVVLVKPENRWEGDPSAQRTKGGKPLRFLPGHLRGLAPAGRLDIDSTGLIVFTQDGRIARALIGEDSSIEKEYLVRVEGKLSDAGLKLLNHGLTLDGAPLKPARVSWQNEDQLRFVLREGKKRQIRRMCEAVGLQVVALKRVRIGGVMLGKLPVGKWRYLGSDERF